MAEEKTPLKWKFEVEIPSSPIIVDGVIYIRSFDKHLYAIDIKTGKEQWKFDIDDYGVSMKFSEGMVYIDGDKYLYAVDSKTGEEKWKFKAGDTITSSTAISEGMVYFGSSDKYFYAIDIKLGKEQWKFKTGDSVCSHPAISDDMIFFGSDDKYLYAVDSKTGEEKWKFKTGDKVYSSPVVSDYIVYFGSCDNHLYAVDIKMGKEQWKFKTEGKVYSTPAVSDNIIYFSGGDYLYALDMALSNGKKEKHVLKPVITKKRDKIAQEKINIAQDPNSSLESLLKIISYDDKELMLLLCNHPKVKIIYDQFDFLDDMVDKELTEDFWSSFSKYRDLGQVEVKESLFEDGLTSDFVSFPAIVDDLFGDPPNIDDLQYFNDRVYGIRINEDIFGFIIKHADDDEIQESLDDADYVIKEQLILKSNHEYFIELLSLILQVEFWKKYIDKN